MTKIGSKNSLYPHKHFTEHLMDLFRKSPWNSDLNYETSNFSIRQLKNYTGASRATIHKQHEEVSYQNEWQHLNRQKASHSGDVGAAWAAAEPPGLDSRISSTRWGNQGTEVKNQVGNEAWACFRPVDRKKPKRKLGKKSGRLRNKQAGKALELITKGRILAEKSEIRSVPFMRRTNKTSSDALWPCARNWDHLRTGDPKHEQENQLVANWIEAGQVSWEDTDEKRWRQENASGARIRHQTETTQEMENPWRARDFDREIDFTRQHIPATD
jgi:hypothetical protein